MPCFPCACVNGQVYMSEVAVVAVYKQLEQRPFW